MRGRFDRVEMENPLSYCFCYLEFKNRYLTNTDAKIKELLNAHMD